MERQNRVHSAPFNPEPSPAPAVPHPLPALDRRHGARARQILCTGVAALCLLANPAVLCAQRPLRIMPAGDSLSSDSVFSELQRRFIAAGFHDYEFVGPVRVEADPKPTARQAYGGAQLKDILNGRTLASGEFQQGFVQTLPAFRPDVILLMGGTNDIGSGDAARAKEAFTALLDQIEKAAPKAIVFVHPIPPVHSGKQYARFLPRIAELNAFIAEEVDTRRNPNIRLVADESPLWEDGDFSEDGLHPLPSGKIKLASSWYGALVRSGLVVESSGVPK